MGDTKPKPLCLCGCGEHTGGGQFRPGHDAKYKSYLVNEAADGNNPEAEAILEARGWTKFLDKRREVVSRPPRERQPRQNQKVLNIAAVELLQLMKAAAKVLKWTGQYKRGTVYHVAITPENALAIATYTDTDLRLPEGWLLESGTQHEPFNEREQVAINAALAESGATC